MQIAVRDDTPRFDVAIGARGSSQQASGNPFDEIMRALNAHDTDGQAAVEREPRQERDTGDDRPARTEDRREHRAARSDDTADRTSDSTAAKTADETAPPADDADCCADTQTDPDTSERPEDGLAAKQDESASDPDEPVAVAQPGVEQTADPHKQPKSTGNGGTPKENPAAAAQALAQGSDDELLAQLEALLQSRAASTGSGQAASPFALTLPNGALNHGLMSAVMAQSMAGQTQTTTAPGATAQQPGQRNAPSFALFNAAAKKAQGTDSPTQGNAHSPIDFKSIAAALANQASGPRDATAAATSGTATESLDAAGGTNTGTPSANATATQALGDRTAQTARAEAPAHTTGQQRLSGPQFAERIGLTIARAAEAGVDRVSIRLNPRDLGRIDVKMELGHDGRMNLTVTADRADTLDQLQRNMRDLERSLNDAGFDTSGSELNFSLRQDQSSNDHAGNSGGRGHWNDGDPGVDQVGAEAEDGMIITHNSDGHMVVDLFV